MTPPRRKKGASVARCKSCGATADDQSMNKLRELRRWNDKLVQSHNRFCSEIWLLVDFTVDLARMNRTDQQHPHLWEKIMEAKRRISEEPFFDNRPAPREALSKRGRRA